MIKLAQVRKLIKKFPGSDEAPCYGTPGFRVKKKLYARMLDDGESLVLKIDFDSRDVLTKLKPESFKVTPHYQNHPMMIVDLGRVDASELAELLEGAWRFCASKKLIAEYDS